MNFQTAFENSMKMVEINSNDTTLSFEVRQYAKTVFMTMQAQQRLIEYREQEAVEELIEFFSHH